MNHSANATEHLLNRAQAGSESAIDDLMDVYRLRLKKMFCVRTADWLQSRVDPSDLVQETLTEASLNLTSYLQERPIAFYPWLRQIAIQRLSKTRDFHKAQKRNVMREAFRMNLSSQSVLDLASRLVGAVPSPSSLAQQAERAAYIRSIVEQMPAKHSELLTLRYLEELSVDECLEVLQISLEAYKKRHFRAAKQLRDLLGGKGGTQHGSS